MPKTATINIRVDPVTKSTAEKLFASFGITITDAVNMFLHKSIMEGGLPFELKQPAPSPRALPPCWCWTPRGRPIPTPPPWTRPGKSWTAGAMQRDIPPPGLCLTSWTDSILKKTPSSGNFLG